MDEWSTTTTHSHPKVISTDPIIIILSCGINTYLWYLGALPTSCLSNQHQRLMVLQTEQDLVPVVANGQPVPLRLQVQRLIGVEDKGGDVVLGRGRIPFGRVRIVIWKGRVTRWLESAIWE